VGEPVPLPIALCVEIQFWAKVQKQPGENGCWLWTGSKDHKGYGHFWYQRHVMLAHRLSWQWTFGTIPPETPCVLHNCPDGDTPNCVNPAHLWLGTVDENNADMRAKGRAGICRERKLRTA